MRLAPIIFLWPLACNATIFDDRQRSAWSESWGAPSSVTSSDFGVGVTAVATDEPGAVVLAAGSNPPSLVSMTYDVFGMSANGGVDLGGAGSSAPLVVGSQEPVIGVGALVAVSAIDDEFGYVAAFDATTRPAPQLVSTVDPSDCDVDPSNFGSAMAFGLTNAGDPSQVDLIVAAGAQLVLLVDFGPETPLDCRRCRLGKPAVSIATSDFDDAEGEEILVALPGRIVGLDGDAIDQDGDNCLPDAPLFELTAPSGEEDFGFALVAGDFEDDGEADFAVSAPASNVVYAYVGADETLHALRPKQQTGTFGVSLEAIDLDGSDTDELVIGDPTSSPEDVQAAGSAFVYEYEGAAFDIITRLYDSTPIPAQYFGRSLGLAEFVGPPADTDLLVVGASDEVFTFFRSVQAGTDPRQ